MQEKLDVFHQKYIELVTNTLFASIDKDVKSDINEFSKLEQGLIDALPKTWESNEDLIQFKQKALDLTESMWQSLSAESFEEFAGDFLSRMEHEIAKFPETIEELQHPDRFLITASDSGLLKIKKRLKNISFRISILPRTLFGKKRAKDLYWKHEVPVQQVMFQHLIVSLSQEIRHIREPLFMELMKAHLALKDWEYSIVDTQSTTAPPQVLNASKKDIFKVKRNVKKTLIQTADACWEEMVDSLQKVDTLELSKGYYDSGAVADRRTTSSKRWHKNEQGWINNFDVFLEDWRSDLAIHKLMIQAQADLELFCENQDANMDEYLGEELDAIQKFIEESQTLLSTAGEEVGSILKKQLYQAQKSLDKEIIPSLIEKLGNKNLVNGIDRLIMSTDKELQKLTVERKVPKVSTEYLSPLSSDDITTMSPYELIAFEISPSLKQNLQESKSRLATELQENLLIAQDLDHMIAFGLNTALEELDEEKGASEAANIAITSLKRAESRSKDVKESLQKAMIQANEQVEQAIKEYKVSLDELTLNENVREIRLRILRAKALKQTEEYRAQIRGTAKSWLGQAINWIKLRYQSIVHLKVRLTRKLIDDNKQMDVEVANFLIDSERIIEGLPVIYRNLYQIHPVNDLELFVGRERELENLSLAYTNWCDNKKGAAIIVGEKWSGLTSFINYSQHADLFNHPCNRFKPSTSLDSENQLLEFFNSIIPDKPQKRMDWDQMAIRLKEGSRRVIIIEDIQCLYLRKIGGFDTLSGLASLVHQTSGHIFWIMTSTTFAWKYLKMTIGMNEAFRFEINFSNPSTEQVEEIIKKRSRISGYKMIFKPSESDQENKKFQKLGEEDQQRYLRDRFFNDMINFASGNISMALMFWLLSTEKVTENEIEIGVFKKPDFSFLMNYPGSWVFALHQLVLHDGLNLEQFSLVSRSNKREATILLFALQEDGILLEKDDYYVINPLIYRSVIALLTSKNLLLK